MVKKFFIAIVVMLMITAVPSFAAKKKAKPPMPQEEFLVYCATGKLSQVASGVKRNAKLDLISLDGITPLIAAAREQDSSKVISYLISKGADPNRANHQGLTPLMACAMHNPRSRIVKALLSGGADPYAIDMTGSTATFYAAQSNNVAVLTVLLAEAPETSDHPNAGGTTPLSAAMRANAKDAQDTLLKFGVKN